MEYSWPPPTFLGILSSNAVIHFSEMPGPQIAYSQNLVHGSVCRPVFPVVAAPLHVFLLCLVDVMYVRSRTRLQQHQRQRSFEWRWRSVSQSQQDFIFFLSGWTSLRAPRSIFPVQFVPHIRVEATAIVETISYIGWYRAAPICVGPSYSVDVSGFCPSEGLEKWNKPNTSALPDRQKNLYYISLLQSLHIWSYGFKAYKTSLMPYF